MSPEIQARVVARPYRDLDDFMRVRQFLLDTYPLYNTYFNWEIRRWEGQWYWGDLASSQLWASRVQLWETEDGQLVGAAHPEGSNLGNLWLEVHPNYRHLEYEMLCWGEQHLAARNEDGRARLTIDVFEYDLPRQKMLLWRGYHKLPGFGVLRWRQPHKPIPDAPLPEGYSVRSMRKGEWADTLRWVECEKHVFPHAGSTLEGHERFHTSPSYRDGLHIVVEAPDGSFAAFAGITFEETNCTAVFEPVGTHPDHLRKGLAKAAICEGLRRLELLGVAMAYVGTGDAIPANRLYESVGFTEAHVIRTWEKIW